MKRTVADLIGPTQNVGGMPSFVGSLGIGKNMEEKPGTEQVFIVSIVVDAHEAEILDGRVVIEKRVIAFDRRHALEKCGFTVKD